MKKLLLFTAMLAVMASAYSQDGVTFQVEKLSKPEQLLPLTSSYEICEELVWVSQGANQALSRDDFNSGILVHSDLPGNMVCLEDNPFFYGVREAYNNHRPLVLSPDMVWLLICQGFSQHVNFNSDRLRHLFVDFTGKKELVVGSRTLTLDSPASEWEVIFPQFTAQIAAYTAPELISALTCDFSTTSIVERVASQITIMNAMKSYFDYTIKYSMCGIPEITLLGSTEDWKRILGKLDALEKYDLEWWVKELRPVLKEFVDASQGKVKTKFWRAMYRQHTQTRYGAPDIIDGWFIKFFPYDKMGNRNSLSELSARTELPAEIVKTDLKYQNIDDMTEIDLEIWAGFFGMEQNAENYSLTPKIGWLVRKKSQMPIRIIHPSTEAFWPYRPLPVPALPRLNGDLPEL